MVAVARAAPPARTWKLVQNPPDAVPLPIPDAAAAADDGYVFAAEEKRKLRVACHLK